MTALRQMTLFAPVSEAELNRHTPLSATLPLFRRHLRHEGRSEYTLRAFSSDLRLLAGHLRADMPVGEVSAQMLADFLAWLEHGRGIPCSRKSLARRVTTLKVYFAWLRASEAIAEDPARLIVHHSARALLPEVLSHEEINRALDAARKAAAAPRPDFRPQFLLRLLLETGIKKGETVRLLHGDFEREHEPPLLTLRYRGRSPQAVNDPEQQARNPWRERRVALRADLLPLLDAVAAGRNAMQQRVFDCSARNLEYLLAGVARDAGLPRLSFEMLRWTCALRDWQSRMAHDALRDKLGLSESSWQQTRSRLAQLSALQSAAVRPEAQLPASSA